MPITVQQFDLLSAAYGPGFALAEAEKSGGVVGTRETPTQLTGSFTGENRGGTLSGGNYDALPGTVVTSASQPLADASVAAADLITPEGRSLQDVMNIYQGDTTNFMPDSSAAPAAAPTPAEALMARANAGEILTVADIATLDPVNDKEQLLAIVDQVLGNLVGQLTDASGAGDQGGVKTAYKNIFDLWQNFYQPGGGRPGQAHIVMLMNTIANRRGFGENHFAGLEQALKTGGEEFEVKGAQMAGGMDTINQGIKDYILSYAGQTDDWTKALRAASQIAYDSQGEQGWTDFANNHGVPTFGSSDEAYAYFSNFWETRRGEDPTYWNEGLGTEDKLGTGQMTATDQTGAQTGGTWTPGANGTPGAPVIPTAGGDAGALGAFGLGAETRKFGDVFPGFISTSPFANIPNVGTALAGAAPYLQSQYQMQSPMIADAIPEGRSRAGEWLRGLSTGASDLLRGNPLAERLREIGAAVGQDVTGIESTSPFREPYYSGTSPLGQNRSQVEAFMSPFALATRGQSDARSAVMNAINRAATNFAYKYPSGIPVAEGTAPEQFLPWALRTNLMGIQDLPEFQGFNWM